MLLCISPLQSAPVDECVLTSMRWGLIPTWFKENDPSKMQYSTSNCRSENILEKKSYKVHTFVVSCIIFSVSDKSDSLLTSSRRQDPMLKGQRCVILADGFYEWQRKEQGKQPFFIYFSQSLVPDAERHEPTTSSKENLVCPPGEASSVLTKVCFLFNCNTSSQVSFVIWKRSTEKGDTEEITLAANFLCVRLNMQFSTRCSC